MKRFAIGMTILAVLSLANLSIADEGKYGSQAGGDMSSGSAMTDSTIKTGKQKQEAMKKSDQQTKQQQQAQAEKEKSKGTTKSDKSKAEKTK